MPVIGASSRTVSKKTAWQRFQLQNKEYSIANEKVCNYEEQHNQHAECGLVERTIQYP
jgi:hypothetical protein